MELNKKEEEYLSKNIESFSYAFQESEKTSLEFMNLIS